MPYELFELEMATETEPGRYPSWYQGHWVQRPYSPLTLTYIYQLVGYGFQDAAEMAGVPLTKGWEFRIANGVPYVTDIPVQSQEEMARREAKFREYLVPWMTNYEQTWGQYKAEMDKNNQFFQSIDVEKAEDYQLRQFLEEARRIGRRHFIIHFAAMYPVAAAYMLFEQTCSEALGFDDRDARFRKLMKGFDNRMFQTDRKLWQLSRRALELGLESSLRNRAEAEILPALQETEKGRTWVQELNTVLSTDGWRQDMFLDPIDESWIENPAPPLRNIREMLGKTGDFSLDEVKKSHVEEREQTAQEIAAKIPADQRPNFMALLGVAQKFGPYSEEHTFYIENFFTSGSRRIMKEIGKRLERGGALEQWQDIFFLTYPEVMRSCVAYEMQNLRPLVTRRKGLYDSWTQMEHPAVIGQVEEVKDILLQKVTGYGVRLEPKVKADVWGVAGSPGVAEGIARVVSGVEELGTVKAGEILVAKVTTTSWTPVFSRIKGVVTDLGGVLGHAAICSREYGIPSVVATREATAKIKTGNKIRVDGNEGAVYILSQ